jgi:hypothetical protein
MKTQAQKHVDETATKLANWAHFNRPSPCDHQKWEAFKAEYKQRQANLKAMRLAVNIQSCN